jgi:mono/diheme cytochrome c family protein
MTRRHESSSKTAVIALVAVAMCLGAARPAASQTASTPNGFVLSGKQEFTFHCASCHGLDARGDGPAADALKSRPPNLRLLSKHNGGTFPEKRVFQIIDGIEAVKAHGTREMPVWGEVFEVQSSNSYNRAETQREVRERIQRLVDYLKSIQESE